MLLFMRKLYLLGNLIFSYNYNNKFSLYNFDSTNGENDSSKCLKSEYKRYDLVII